MSLLAAIAGSLSAPYDPAASALFARMSPAIAADEKEVYNTAILALKAAGIWSTLDCMGSFYAPHSQAALLNWTENDHNVTAVNSPTFTAYTGGYATNGTTQYLEIDYIPATDAVNMSQNSATVACEVTGGTDAASNTVLLMGVSDGTRQIDITPWRSSDNFVGARLNQSASSVSTSTVATRLGLTSASRTGSNAIEIYRNGASLGNDTDASNGLPQTYKVWIGGKNVSGAINGPAANTFGAWALGGQWTDQQHDDFYDIMTAFRTSMAAL